MTNNASHSLELTQVIIYGNGVGLDLDRSGVRLFSYSHAGTASVVVSSSLFEKNVGIALFLSTITPFVICDSSFVNNTLMAKYDDETSGIVLIEPEDGKQHVTVSFSNVTFLNNTYKGENGGIVYISNPTAPYNYFFSNCTFQNNVSPNHGTVMYIDNSGAVSNDYNSSLMIVNSVFNKNTAENIIYVEEINLTLSSVQFVNNVGRCLYLSKSSLHLSGNMLFSSNSANNGAALYCYRGTNISITEGASVTFIENNAWAYGGAIFVDVDPVLCQSGFSPSDNHTTVLFQDNIAWKAGNSIYFSIPDSCPNISNYELICHFSYTQSSQPFNCTGNYTKNAPVVTSPYMLSLYFPDANGVKISNQTFFIHHSALGIPLIFLGIVYDYFNTPCEQIIFDVQCIRCPDSIELAYHYIFVVDNTSPLSMSFVGPKVNHSINVTVVMSSPLLMPTTLIVELLPCQSRPGNVYNTTTKGCTCFHSELINCSGGHNEIKRGYWFGNLRKTPTTSLCPIHYCKFHHTKKDYCMLPDTVDAQCNHHRSGIACRNCSDGYTLAYDFADCISVDHCSPGRTVLVVVLTGLYWIVVVVGVFSAMYLSVQVSLGYFYGIIYFYSMVVVLLHDNPDMTDNDKVFRIVSVLSSFAQLSPKFLGKLCFMKGLSGIDQIFIHYFHAAAVSLLVLGFVVVARCSRRITRFIGRCIIRVICLLLYMYT